MRQHTIRPVEPRDLPQLLDIYNHYVVHTAITFDLEPATLEQRSVWLQQFAATGRHRLLVADDGARVLAYAGTTRFRVKAAYDPTVEVTCYCAPDATGLGIGTALYRALFDALSGEDIHAYIAAISLPNPASLVLHERFGFAHVGTLHAVGRKFDRYWDVSWLERVGAG